MYTAIYTANTRNNAMSLINEQLNNETAIYNNLKKQNRQDYICKAVLDRLEKEIIKLRDNYDAETNRRKKINNDRSTGGFICYVKKVVGRNWLKLRKYYKTIFTLPKD